MDDDEQLSQAVIQQLVQATAQRPSREAKPVGEGRLKLVVPRIPAKRSRNDDTHKNKGKRKRDDSSLGGIESGLGSGLGIGVSGNESGKGKGEGNGSEDGGEEEEEGENIRRSIKREPTGDPKVRSPPSECRPRLIKKDHDVKITEGGPKMADGDAPRYYAKIVREIEIRNEGTKEPFPKYLEESFRMPNHPPILLALVDLSLFQTPDCVHRISNRELVRFALGPAVLPLLKQWAYMWLNPDDDSRAFLGYMRRTFPMAGEYGKPWKNGVKLVAEHAARQVGFNYQLAPLLYTMSSFAQRLVNANMAFFQAFGAYSQATDEVYKFAARMLLVVWEDLEADRNGFFGVLFKGELARAHRPEVRRAYEGWYVVDERMFQ